MNYMFVMPRYIKNPDEVYIFPLGIAYVSASLKQNRDSVYNVNLNLDLRSFEEVLREKIEKWNIDVILTGGLSPHFKQIREIINAAKKIKPSVIAIAGGGLVTATPKVVMEGIPNMDIGMIGEGEYTVCEIADALERGDSLQEIKGIVYREKEGDIIVTEERQDIEDLDSLPFPDYDGFDFNKKSGIYICTSRSCPYNCTFCFHTCGKKYRARSLESIFTEIDWLVEKYDVKFLGILDELFSTNVNKMNDFCDRIVKYKIQWSCQMRVDRLNLEILEKMKKSGCISVSLGIENACNEILNSMEKHITIEQIESALYLARKAKINPFGNLLLGDKDDTVETVERSLEWYESHPEFQLGYCRIMVLPGSKLYQHAVDNGYIKDELKYLEDDRFPINVTKMTAEEYRLCVNKMDKALMRRLYQADKICVKSINKQNVSISCECPNCKCKIELDTNDFSGSENYTCLECGQNYNISLYQVFKTKIEDKLEKILTRDKKKIAMWGLANVGMRIAYMCSLVEHPHFFLVDKDINRQGECISGKAIQDPKEIYSADLEYLIVGTNDFITNGIIKKAANQSCRKVKKIMNIDDFFLECLSEYN